MRQKLLLSLFLTFFTSGFSLLYAQTTLRLVDFESSANYSVDTAEYVVNTGQFFGRFTSASEGTSHDLGAAGATGMAGTQGTSYFATEFLTFPERTLTVSSVSVSGYNTINLQYYFAASGSGYDPAGTSGDWIRVEYSFDGGSWNTVVGYAGSAGAFRTDPNLDNDGADGIAVNGTLTDNTFAITRGPADVNLSVRIRMYSTGGGEEYVFDHIRITGVADAVIPVASAPTNTAQTLKGGTVSTSTVQSTEAGNIYLVLTGEPATTMAQINTAIAANKAFLGKSAAVAATPYTVTPGASLLNGVYDIVAVDNSGNLSAVVPGWLTVDNTAPTPSAPTNTAQRLKSGATSTSTVQSSEAGNIYLVLNGEAATTVALITTAIGANKAFVGQASAVAATPYTVTLPASLVDGVYNIIAADAAGNVSTALGGWLTVDNTAPTDQATVFASSVSRQPGATVTITAAAESTDAVWFAPAGTSSFTASATMTTTSGASTSILAPATPGAYKLYLVDVAGNISNESAAILTVDNTAPTASAPTSTAQTLKSGSVSTSTVQSNEAGSIYLVKNGVAATTTAQINTAITANDAFLGQGSAAANTPYTVTIAASLNNGVYDIVAVDNAGNVSPIVAGWLTVDNTAPTASTPTSTAQTLKSGTVSTSTVQSTEAGNIYLVKNGVAATTQALINTAITANDAFLAQGSATANTAYTVTPAVGLNDGLYDVVAVDNAGNVSAAFGGWLTIDNTAPSNQNTVLAATVASAPSTNINIVSSGDGTNAVWLAPSGTTTFIEGATMTKAASGTATQIATPATDGTYKLFVLDAAGNISTASTASVVVFTQATNITFTAPASTTQLVINWTNGTGGNRLVVVKTSGASFTPSNGTNYNAASASPVNFTSGSDLDLGAGNVRSVYNGSGSGSVTVTNLTAGTTYTIQVYEYAAGNLYLTSSATGNPINRSTINGTAPSSSATGPIAFTSISGNSMSVQFTQGNGSSSVLVMRGGVAGGASPGAVTFAPVDGVSYTANTDYSAGVNQGSGDKVIAYRADASSGTPIVITGLLPDVIYTFAVYEMNGTAGDGSENYYTASPLTGNRNTEPATQTTGITFTGVTETGMTVNWSAPGDGDGRVVIMRQGSAVATDPTDYTTYTTASGNFNFGVSPAGSPVGSGYLVFDNTSGSSVAITNLLPGNTYHFAMYDYNHTTSQSAPNKVYLTPATTASQATGSDVTAPAGGTVGSVTVSGGTVNAGYWNSTNTGLTVVVPLSTTDGSLDGGRVQVRLKMTGGAFADIPVSGDSVITTAQRTAGTKTIFIKSWDLENAITGFTEGNVSGLSSSETKFLIIGAQVYDLAGNVSPEYTQSATTLDVDQTPPTITSSSFFASFNPATDASFTNCNGSTPSNTSTREYVHLTMSEPLSITAGQLPTLGTPGFTASAGVFDTGCDSRAGTAYHPTNVIHLQVNFITGSTDGAWDGSTTFGFTAGGTNVKDPAGNEMATVATIVPGDNTAPSLSTGMVFSLNGTGPETITFSLDESLHSSITNNVLGFTVSQAGLNTAVTNYNSATRTVTLTSTTTGQWTDAITVDYDQGTGDVRDQPGNELATINDEPILIRSVHIQSNNTTNTGYAIAGNTVTLTFNSSRTLTALPTVTFDVGGTNLVGNVTPAAGPFTGPFTATATITAGVGNGNLSFEIVAEETAKTTTVTSTTDASAVIVDKVQPTVVLSDNQTDNIVRDADNVSFTATFTEANAIDEDTPPTITIGTVVTNAAMTKTSNLVWTYTWDVPVGTNGTANITITAKDEAGNANTAATGTRTSFIIDNTQPTVVLSDGESDNSVRDANTVLITATFTEVNAIYETTPPAITIGTLVTGAAMTKTSNLVWTYSWNVPAGNSGTHAVSIAATDVAGNSNTAATGRTSWLIDNNAPTVVLSDAQADNIVRDADNVTITATFTEANALSGTPTITIGSIVTAQNMTGGPLVWTYTWDVPSGNNGNVAVSVSASDVAGNPNAAATGRTSWLIDNTAPTVVLSDDQADNIVRDADNVTITATFTEANGLAATPKITIGSLVTSQNMLGGPLVWTYSWDVPTGNDGAVAVSVSTTDVAGNANTAATGTTSYTIDNTVPVASTIDISTPTVIWDTLPKVNGTYASSISWLVTFTESTNSLTGIDAADFQLYRNGALAVPDGDLTFTLPVVVTGSGNTRTVTLNNVKLLNTITNAQLYINLINDGSIKDAAGNSLASALSSSVAYPGTSTPGIGLNNDYYTILFPEPADPATNLLLTGSAPYNFSLSWDQPAAPDSANFFFFQIKRDTASTFGPALTDGMFHGHFFYDQNVGGTRSFNFTNHFPGGIATPLNSGATYDVKIISTNYSGWYNSFDLLDYNLASTLNGSFTTGTAQQTTISSTNLASTISSIVDETPAGQSVNVATFTIDDDGPAATDGTDDAPFKFTSLVITPGSANGIANWTQALAGAELLTPTDTIAGTIQYNVFATNTSSITFSGFASATAADFGFITDNASKTYTLRIWLKSSLGGTLPTTIDGLKFDFLMSGANFTLDNGDNQVSSQFALPQTPSSGGITVDVPTEGFNFVTQPSPTTVLVLKNFTTAPVVNAVDRNNNRDLGFHGTAFNVSVTNAGSIAMNPGNAISMSITPSLGVITFPANFQYTGAGNGTLTVTRGTINSNTAVATTGSVACSTVTVEYSNLSTITAGTGTTRVLSTVVAAPGASVFTFTYNDDGGVGLGDGANTEIDQIIITPDATNELDWSIVLAGATLSDGTNTVSASSITASGITFSGAAFTASPLSTVTDGGASASKTYTLRVWFNQSLGTLAATADQDHLVFSMSTASPANLVLATASSAAPAAAAVTSGASNGMFEVDATLLAFQSDFTGALATTPVPPAANAGITFLVNTSSAAHSYSNPVVQAVDIYGNRDTNYGATVTTTAAGGMTLNNPLTTLASGIGTFPSTFSYAATGNGKLTVTTATNNRVGVLPAATTSANSQAVSVQTGTATRINSPSTSAATISSLIDASPGETVFTFSISDDPAGTPALQNDGNPTKITDIIITGSSANNTVLDWSQAIAGARLEDAADNTKYIDIDFNDITTNTLTFNGILIAAAGDLGVIDDDQTKTYNLKIWLKTDLSGINNYNNTIDGLKFGFDVLSANVTTNSTGTSLLSGLNANTTNVSSTVDVDATQLDFTYPTSSTAVSINADFAPIVMARDENGNLDTGFSEQIDVLTNASGVTMTSTPAVVGSSFVSGIFNFPADFKFTSGNNNDDVTLSIEANGIENIPVTPGPAPYTPVLTLKTNTITIGSLSEPATISSLSTATPVSVFDFVVNDDDLFVTGTDSKPTRLKQIKITKLAGENDITNWSHLIQSATLHIGAAAGAGITGSITADSITFNGINASVLGTFGWIQDNNSKNFTLKILLKSALGGTLPSTVDNLNIAFEVLATNIEVYPTGTPSSTFSASENENSGTGTNAIQVVATKLKWTTNPASDILVKKDISLQLPVPVIEAMDVNNNRDLNYTTSLNITNTENLQMSSSSTAQSTVTTLSVPADGAAPLAGGIYTFPTDFRYDNIGSGNIGNGTMYAVPSVLNTIITSHQSDTVVTVRVGNSSTITAGAGAEPTEISSLVNVHPGVQVFDFDINDDPGSTPATENDGVPTQLNGLYITYGSGDNIVNMPEHDWTHAIEGALLVNGTDTISVSTIASTYLYFDLTSVAGQALGLITDNGTKNFKLRMWLKDSLESTLPIKIDGLHFVFDVQQANIFTDASGTSILTSPYQTQNSGAGNNEITVEATVLDFTNPITSSSASINVPFLPLGNPVTVEARDVNGNRDQDFEGADSRITDFQTEGGVGTDNEPLINSGLHEFTDGVFTFSTSFQYTSDVAGSTTEGTITIEAGAGSLPAIAGESPDIDIISSFESSLQLDPTFRVPDSIAYINHQASDIVAETDGYELLRALLVDGSRGPTFMYGGKLLNTNTDSGDGFADTDEDGADTYLDSLAIRIYKPSVLRKIELWSNGAPIAGTEIDVVNDIPAIDSSTVYYDFEWSNGILVTATDNSISTLSIRVTFRNTSPEINDHDDVQIQLMGARVAGGSQFFNGNPANSGNGGPYIAGGQPKVTPDSFGQIEVAATSLDFESPSPALTLTQPSSYAGKQEPIDGSPEASPGGATGIVYARDAFGLIDIDFDSTATVTAPAVPISYPSEFQNGVLDLTGMQYQNAGDGTLTVEAGDLNSDDAPHGISEPSSTVDVIHVTAVENKYTVDLNESLKGGSVNKRIFGLNFTAEHKTGTEPSLEGFSIIFRDSDGNPYPYLGAETIFKNFKLYLASAADSTNIQILTAGTDYTLTEEQTAALAGQNPPPPSNYRDKLTFTLITPAPLYQNDYRFYLNVDVDVNVTVGTEPITPHLVDLGYGFPNTNGHINTTVGSSRAVVQGITRNFASTKPPVLEYTNPYNGQLNVVLAQDTIKMKFDVPVVSFDGQIKVYNRDLGTYVIFTAPNGPGRFNGNANTLDEQVVDTLKFVAPAGFDFEPDAVYYITIEKGVYSNTDFTQRKGISDEGFNLYGGISYSGTFYFKGSSLIPPKMLQTANSKYYFTPGTATFNFMFDKPGKVHYMVVHPTSPGPAPLTVTNDQILGNAPYTNSTIIARGTTTIDQVSPNLQFATIQADLVNGVEYYVYVCAENDALPTPYFTSAPYGTASENDGHIVGTDGPTFKITKTAATTSALNNPRIEVCANSSVKIEDPIIISERGTSVEFTNGVANGNKQTFNLLLPTGFQFDITKAPTIEFNGTDFGTLPVGTEPYRFRNSALLEINFVMTKDSANIFNNIVLSDLYIIASSTDISGNITRFGGNGLVDVPDDGVLARITSGSGTSILFTNSYEQANSPWPYSQIVEAEKFITYIPDNFATSVKLSPLVPTGDYGASFFSGSGLTNDELTLSAVTLDAAFNVTLTHTDQNGCNTTTVEQYLVYDHNTAIPELLKDSVSGYSISGTKIGLKAGVANPITNVPGLPTPTLQVSDTVSFEGLAGYQLIDLYADIPQRVQNSGQVIDFNSLGWRTLVQQIPQLKQSFYNPVLGQTFKSYYWEYSHLINVDSTSAAGVQYPYDPSDTTKRFVRSSGQGRTFFEAGSLGVIEFTGIYQSTADFSVFIPFKQEVELFIPAVPVVEVTGEISYEGRTPLFCESSAPFTITGYPLATSSDVTGSFTLKDSISGNIIIDPGFVDNGNGTASFNPASQVLKNGYNTIKVEYTFQQNNSPAVGTGSLYIRVTPNPEARFTQQSDLNAFVDGTIGLASGKASATNAYCIGIPIEFDPMSSTIAADSITSFIWNFGDINSATNVDTTNVSDPTIVNVYPTMGTYSVQLTAISNRGCSSINTDNVFNVTVGAIPVVNFDLVGISTADTLVFTNNSTVQSNGTNSFSEIESIIWEYGDGDSDPAGEHVYDEPGHYLTRAIVTTAIGSTSTAINAPGCSRSFDRHILILDKKTGSFEDRFETNNRSWHVLKDSLNTNGLPSLQAASWQRGTPSSSRSKINSTPNTGGPNSYVWATGLSGEYSKNERSFLYSPVVDISGLIRPMISFHANWDLQKDGVVLEYSTDNKNVADPTKIWKTIGTNVGGVNWFNDQIIGSKPGNQPSGDYGWSGSSNGWVEAKHELSASIDPSVPRNNVAFRFGFASVNEGGEGFAIDNVRIGNRTRIVLLENFKNVGNTETAVRAGQTVIAEKFESDSLKVFNPSGTDSSVVKLNYHVGFPSNDPFNLDNQQDPDARALYYNISQTPRVQMDGSMPVSGDPLFSAWGKEAYSVKSLKLADAKIKPTIFVNEDEQSVGLKVNVTALRDLGPTTILHVAIVEKSVALTSLSAENQTLVKTGETSFEYVVKKLLPNAAGTRFNAELEFGTTRTFPETDMFTWPSIPLYSADNLAVVIFLQDEDTKEVYQTEIVDLANPGVVTGIDPETDPEKQFNVYPSPADDQITVELPEAAQKSTALQLFDQFGKVVNETTFEKGERRKTIATSEFAAGIYVIQIPTEKLILRRKVMVMHKN